MNKLKASAFLAEVFLCSRFPVLSASAWSFGYLSILSIISMVSISLSCDRFDSRPERITGILLHSLGMIKKFEEGMNLHIRTNGSKQHSVDFKVGDVFLEYHPVSILEWKNGMNFEDTAKRKYDHITYPKYLHRTNLYVFDAIDTLYDIILNDPELRFYVRYPYFGADFGKKEWNALVSEVYRKVNEYDKSYPRKKK